MRTAGPALLRLLLLLGCTALLGGCWIERHDYEIDITVDIEPIYDNQEAKGYGVVLWAQTDLGCSEYNHGHYACAILGRDTIEIPGEVTVEGTYSSDDDDCFEGILVGAYRDTSSSGPVHYHSSASCGLQYLQDPFVREAPIDLELDDTGCFEGCYWSGDEWDTP